MAVRTANRADVAVIARVMVASWELTYRGLVPDAMIDRLTVGVRERQWEQFFEAPPDRSGCFVALSDQEVVGMAAVGPAPDGPGATVGEVRAIYVIPSRWGQGFGRALMLTCLDWLRADGFSQATLWVLDTNDRGRRFYESGGWETDGAEQVDSSFGEPLNEVRYRIALQ